LPEAFGSGLAFSDGNDESNVSIDDVEKRVDEAEIIRWGHRDRATRTGAGGSTYPLPGQEGIQNVGIGGMDVDQEAIYVNGVLALRP